jgi:hypothetical protein
MPCAQCGAENPPGTKFCSNCGTAIQPAAEPPGYNNPPPGYAAQPPGYGTQSPGFGGTVGPQQARPPTSISIDFRRLGTGDIVAMGGSVLLFISLFLTWYSTPGFSTSALGSSADGVQVSGGWRVLILVLDIIILLYLFLRTMTPRGLRLPLPHWQLLTVLLSLQVLLTLIAFLVKPGDGVHWSWGYGAFIGLVASIIALGGGIMRRNEAEIVVPGVPRAGFSSFRSTPGGPQMGATPGGGAQGTICAQCGTAVPTGTPYCTTCGAPTSG